VNYFNLGPLHFQAQTWLIVLVVIVLTLTITLGVMATRRSTRPNRTGSLEGLRLLCVLFVCTMLLGP
jgi:Ca2+/Na+ antiporter